jgi:DivIVA domain-containing protein
MPNLTPSDVRNVAFGKAPLGRRGYDEEQVDTFLDAVERTILALAEEVASLRAQLGRGVLSHPGSNTPSGAEGPVLAELEQIRSRLARLEATVAGAGLRPPTGDPIFGGGR